MPVVIPRGEIHLPVYAFGILAQLLFDAAHRLDKFTPIHRTQKTQTADAIADRNLICRLALRFRLNHLFNRQAGLGKPLLDPVQRQRQCGVMPLQTPRQHRHKRVRQRRIRPCHVGNHQNQAFRVFLGDFAHLIGPDVCLVTVDHAGGDPRADTAQILDQRQTQHDRNGPQLAQFKVSGFLVRRYITIQTFRIHPSVAVGYRLHGDVVNARQAG